MKITATKINEVWMKLESDDPGIIYEIADKYSFYVANHRHHPKVRAGIWDGRIRLFHLGKRRLYCGLIENLKAYCKDKGYELETIGDFSENELSIVEFLAFIKTLNLPAWIEIRDYQVKQAIKAIRKKRLTILSPTSSGKSLMIYMIYRYFNIKTLIIVPNIGLVEQMAGDFEEYGLQEEIHKVSGGVEKETDLNLTISTWQSLYKQPREWWEEQEFEMIFADEAHGAKADQFTKILENMEDTKYRFGCTGTLDDTVVNPTIIQGLLGEKYQIITTKQLMDQGYIAKLDIKAIVLDHKEAPKGMKYQPEVDYICAHTRRNKFITNLVSSLKGNTMVIFKYVDKHGRILEELFKQHIKGKNIYWISGATDGESREEIRKIVDTETNAVLLGSEKAVGTGTSIRNISNLVFVTPSKAKIQTLQNIGRSLRKSASKDSATLYDIADRFKNKKNYTFTHFQERLKIYDAENFDYKIYEVDLK